MGSPASSIAGGGGGGTADPNTVLGPATSTDNALARWDGATGTLLQDGPVTESAVGVLAGITQLNVDNLRLDGSTVSTENVDGDLILGPNGAGNVSVSGARQLLFPAGTASLPGLGAAADPDTGFDCLSNNVLTIWLGGAYFYQIESNRFYSFRNDGIFVLGADSDVGYGWVAAGVGRMTQGASGLGALRQGQEVVARTADLALTTAQSGIVYTNTGAAGQVIFTLPAATLTNGVGPCFGFCVRAAQNIRIVAAGTDVINLPAAASAGGGRIDSNTVRSVVWLFVSGTGFWDAQPTGTWTAT